jgi:hypothetical protein
MRTATTMLAGACLLSIAACNKPAPASGASSAAAPSQAASATPAAPAAGPISAENLPHRKPGLWRQTMAMEGVEHAMPATEFCIDAASEAKMSLMGQQMSKDHCQAPQFNRNLDGSLSFTSACDFEGGGKTTSKGTISGDFDSSYKVAIDSTTTGGTAGMDQHERKMTITATWEGPCAPDQKGGDIILPGGRKMNMLAGR